MILYFEDSNNIRRQIGEPKTEKDVYLIINEFLKKHNYKSHYTRSWINESNPREKIYDVGSHTEFFICYDEH